MKKETQDKNSVKSKPALKPAKKIEQELAELKEEFGDLSTIYEEALARTNTLTLEAEIARLEFEQVFNAVGDAIWVIDNEYTVLLINTAFLDIIGLKQKSAAIGKKCHELLPSAQCNTSDCPLKQILRGKKRIELDADLEIKEGTIVPFLITSTPLYGLSGDIIGIVEQYKDITERRVYENELEKANLELKRLATIDGLTGLSNRRSFDEKLKHEWMRMRREQQPLALILCDIDYFKLYNDCYGHQQGDTCLKEVAAAMSACLKRPADMAARYGGEEFGIILPNTPAEGAFHVAETMRSAISHLKLQHARSEVSDTVSLSFGLSAIIPATDTSGIEKLIQTADKALYASKESGRNRVTSQPL